MLNKEDKMSIISNKLKLVRLALNIPDTISYMQASDLDKYVSNFLNASDEIESKWYDTLTAVMEGSKLIQDTPEQQGFLQEGINSALTILKDMACLAWFLVFKEDYYTNAYLYVNGVSTLELKDYPLGYFVGLCDLKEKINPNSNLGGTQEYKTKIIEATEVLDLLLYHYAKDYTEDQKPIWKISKIMAAMKAKDPKAYVTYHKGMVNSKVYMDYTATKVPALTIINTGLLGDPNYIADPIARALERHYADAVRLSVEENWCSNKNPTILPNTIKNETTIWNLFNTAIRLRRQLPYTYKILIDKYAIKIKESLEALYSFNTVEATHNEVTFHYNHDDKQTNVIVPIVANNIYKME